MQKEKATELNRASVEAFIKIVAKLYANKHGVDVTTTITDRKDRKEKEDSNETRKGL